MKSILKKPYVYFFIGIFLAYFALNIFVSKFYLTLFYLPVYFKTLDWGLFVVSLVFSILIAILVAANTIFLYLRYQERKLVRRSAITSCLATIGGLTTGICPACAASFFPLLLGAAGITFSWSMLPFKGFEIQFFIIIALLFSLYYLRKHSNRKIISEEIINKGKKQ